MQTLQQGSLLQGGRYKILSTLGQGGFGITYLALQSGLERKVAIKEFFMKDLCNRDEATSHVSVGSTGSVDMVERFKAKFLKEARNMARLNHPNIVRIHDIFEENGTAYYVMEYAEGGSLADKVKRLGYVPEPDAVRYIRQIADALGYIHMQKMNHLDVKPANIMLSEADDAILIDFGLSKQYDATTGNQTSTTPVGISDGYAPMEQYRPGGVGEFSPETDVYSLGATFFKLLTGVTPPSASDVNEDGVPVAELKAKGVSQASIDVICKAMEGRKKDRIKGIDSFVRLLGNTSVPIPPVLNPVSESNDEEATIVNVQPVPSGEPPIEPSTRQKSSSGTNYGILAITVVVIAIIVAVLWGLGGYTGGETPVPVDDSLACDIVCADSVCADSVCVDSIPAEFVKPVKSTTTSLCISTFPSNVTVYVDGKRIGTTPIKDVEVPFGEHKIKLSKKGYEEIITSRTFGKRSMVINETLTKKTQKQSYNSSTIDSVCAIENHENEVDDDRIWNVAEENASFPGGEAARLKWIEENLRYPSACQEQGVQGRVTVSFVVERDGSIVDVQVLRSPNEHLSEEAVRVVKLMPKWEPAKQGNRAVRSRFNLPITFRLL